MQTISSGESSERPVQPLTDLQIIERVSLGDVKAFEGLMRRYNRLVFRTVRSIARSDAEAEDVAQEAWIAAYQHLKQFEGKAAFSTWVSRIAIRMAISRARRRPNLAALDELDRSNMSTDGDGDPARTAERRQLGRILERAVDELPTEYRVVLVLRDVEQCSTGETAEILGLTEENVRVRLHRSRAALRELLREQPYGTLETVFAFDGQRCDRVVVAVLARLLRST
jgi:RNA polymerase sigma-70 factor (ECF subfamily)